MNPDGPRLHRPLCLLAGTLLAILLVGACDSEPPTICSTEGLGVLEGYLRETGAGVSATVAARALEGPNPGRITHQTVSDSTGWYRLELPTGLFRLEVEPYGGGIGSTEEHDTIRVLPRVFRFDLDRGRADVRIGMPDDLDGRHFNLRLTLETEENVFDSTSESANVEEGWLTFTYPLLPPGDYTMRLAGSHLTNWIYLPHTLMSQDADLLPVGTRVPAGYEIDFRQSYASIAGRVTGSWQQAGSYYHPAVDVFSPDSLKIGRVGVNDEGEFTCGFPVAGTVRLRVEYRGVFRWLGGDSFATATVFELTPGDRVTGADLIESGIRVTLNGPGNLAEHHPDFTVRDETGREFHPELYGDNPAAICNLSPGRYYLHIDGVCEDEEWAPQWYGGAENFAGAVPIDLVAGELRDVTLDLVEGGRLEGNLLRADGTRPRGVYFGLFDAAGEPLCPGYDQWRRFDEGRYRFRGLANGDYLLAVQVTNDELWWYPGTFAMNEAQPITIENHAALTDIDWNLP